MKKNDDFQYLKRLFDSGQDQGIHFLQRFRHTRTAPLVEDRVAIIPRACRSTSLTLLRICSDRGRRLRPRRLNRVTHLPFHVAFSRDLKIGGFEAGLWNVVTAPAATPEPVIAKLNEATLRVMADTAFQEELRKIGIDPIADSTPAAARAFIGKERARLKPVVDAAGVSTD